MEKCLCQRLGNIQCVCRSSIRLMYPQAQSSQPTNYWSEMPTVQPNLCFRVRPGQPSTESCLTSTSATLLAAQTSLSNSTDCCKQAKHFFWNTVYSQQFAISWWMDPCVCRSTFESRNTAEMLLPTLN